MAKFAVQSVGISAIAHATDDLAKVQASLNVILPQSLRDRQLFTRRYLEGHHRNPIVTFDAKLTTPEEVEEFTAHLLRHLSRSERIRIVRDLGLHSDADGNLFLRLNKQQAFRGSIELGEDDAIRVRFKFNRLLGAPEELMRKILEAE